MNPQPTIDWLCRQPVLHIDMLEGLRRGQADVVLARERGVLLYHRASRACMISAQEDETARQIIAAIPSCAEMVVAHQPDYLARLRESFHFEHQMDCHQVAYLSREPIDAPQAVCQIRVLDERHLDFVQQHYSHLPDRDYLLERLRAGVMHGAYVQGRLAGFIGMHSEGSIGILEVLPQYRRRGIARALQIHMTNWNLERGYTPFAQVVCGNSASLELQRKLGYTLSDELVYWLH